MPKDAPFCVAVDWGTSSFRSWLLSISGQVLGHFFGPMVSAKLAIGHCRDSS